MATLFWFLLGTGLCIAISRYNEDDALFWKLFIAFTGSFAAATAYKATVDNEKQENVIVVNEAPTQVLQSMPCNFYTLADISFAATKREKSPKPVSKDTLINKDDSLLSKVHVLARGQPGLFNFFNTS
jgi:hypothetical protein